MQKVSASTTTVYIFSGTKVIAEYQNGAAPADPTREYIYSGNQLLAKVEGGVTNYYHADQLSVRATTDSSGNVIGQQGHYPFGESWYAASTTTKWQFTSYEGDSESLNDYAMFRYNLNRLSRFSSPDPLGGSAADPQSLNRYAYVLNDPTNLVDPLGLQGGDDPRIKSYEMENPYLTACFGTRGHAAAFGAICELILEGIGQYDPALIIAHQLWPGAPPQKPPQPTKPNCFAQLKTGPVDNPLAQVIGVTHSFWYVQGSSGLQYTVSAGPTGLNGTGSLNVSTSQSINTGADNVSATVSWVKGLSSANCSGVDNLLNAANAFPNNTIRYSAFFGPNSNSAAHYLGVVGGFNPPIPPGAWGWNVPVPVGH